MLNARTWHRLCVSAYFILPAVIIGWILPENSILIWPVGLAVVWGIFVAVFGAVQGIRLARGSLFLGCPLCNAKSQVTGGNRDGMYLDCFDCGELRFKPGSLFGLKVIRTGSPEDDLANLRPESRSPLLAPRRHLFPFLLIFLPVLGSIVTATLIHEFSFFYILIPGFWCYAVGGFILDGIFGGRMSDNHGTAQRSRTPFRFWAKVCIWSLFYLFAAAYPIAYALQERAKLVTNGEAGEVEKVPDPQAVEKASPK